MIPLILRDNTYNDGSLTEDQEGANLLEKQEAPELLQLDPPLPGFLSFYEDKQRNLGLLLSDGLSCILGNWWDEVPGVQRQCHQETGKKASTIKNIVFRRGRSKKISKAKKGKIVKRKRMMKVSASQKGSSKNKRKSATAPTMTIAKPTCDTEGMVTRPWVNLGANIEDIGNFTKDRYICNCLTCRSPISSIAQPVSDVMLNAPSDPN